jgi:hypothetical protein
MFTPLIYTVSMAAWPGRSGGEGMGRYKFVKARSYKDYWIINELTEQCNEEGRDGRFRWCHTGGERTSLPFIETGTDARLVVSKDRHPKIVGFYAFDRAEKRLDVLYVVPRMRDKGIALDMVSDFAAMFPGESELHVLQPCLAVRRMLNKHFPGLFRAIEVESEESYIVHYNEEDLRSPGATW